MNYLLLIYSNEAQFGALPESELKKMTDEYMDFTKSIVQAGQFKAGDRLKPVSSASTVRVRNGKAAITDGPFAETREQLGGYYLIEAKNLDEATAIAARIPGAQNRQHRGAAGVAADDLKKSINAGNDRRNLSPGSGSGARDIDPLARRFRFGGRSAARGIYRRP